MPTLLPATGNYLRVRGEYDDPDPKLYRFQELPPRARRIPGPALIACACGGTTSACAENTRLPRLLRRQRWNYLRVRGEYRHTPTSTLPAWELPPRARRIHVNPIAWNFQRGTTSACAENTIGRSVRWGYRWNYLRVRGEYFFRPFPSILKKGTTSACAENTPKPAPTYQ